MKLMKSTKTNEVSYNRRTKQDDNYICECGKRSTFGGEGYVDPNTDIFYCGYCNCDPKYSNNIK